MNNALLAYWPHFAIGVIVVAALLWFAIAVKRGMFRRGH